MRAHNATDPEAEEERRALLTGLFEHIGDNAIVEPPFHCDYGWNILLGAAAYVNVNCVILDCAAVTIGALTMLGPGVQLCAAAHPVDPGDRERDLEYALPIVVGTNVWIAANVVVAGNPSRIVRHL